MGGRPLLRSVTNSTDSALFAGLLSPMSFISSPLFLGRPRFFGEAIVKGIVVSVFEEIRTTLLSNTSVCLVLGGLPLLRITLV